MKIFKLDLIFLIATMAIIVMPILFFFAVFNFALVGTIFLVCLFAIYSFARKGRRIFSSGVVHERKVTLWLRILWYSSITSVFVLTVIDFLYLIWKSEVYVVSFFMFLLMLGLPLFVPALIISLVVFTKLVFGEKMDKGLFLGLLTAAILFSAFFLFMMAQYFDFI